MRDVALAAAVFAVSLSGPIIASPPALADAFRPDGVYDASVPTPASVLGFEIGDRPVRHNEIERYAEALAAASPRVQLERYATSHEGRDLFLLVIASDENAARLEEIRAAIARLADPRQSSASERDQIIRDTPAIAYLAYSIHGDELSSADAALRVAYELAAGENEDVRTLRDHLVVLIDPVQNPDGRERILSMIGAYQGGVPNPDPDDLAHNGFWPWGRTNHYLFDLNRDWLPLVHPESRGRAGILQRWHPQLMVDSHEMGSRSTYLFNPPRDPFNPNLPQSTRSWWDQFSRDQAAAFDRYGWSYYTREWNEEFFPGYGSAIALYQGAIGILYEQARTGGLPTRKPSGRIETFLDAAQHQFTSSLANLATTAGNREALLRSYWTARREAIDRGSRGTVRAFYIAPLPDATRAAHLADRISALGIEVERLESAGTIRGARDLWSDDVRSVTLPAGSYRIRLDQPNGLLARAILEPHTPMPDSSVAEEREHLERQKETRIYDTTAWSLLLAAGVESYWTGGLDGLSWQPVEGLRLPQGRFVEGEARYGWLFRGDTDRAVALASHLVAAGFKVRTAIEPFVVEARRFPRGSFLLRREENGPETADTLRARAATVDVEIVPASSARILEGPDLGGDYWSLLQEARIAIAAGPRLNSNSVGAAWHALDHEFGIRASLIDASELGSAELKRYNVLVFPDAWDGKEAYHQVLDEGDLSAVRQWVENGGTLVAIGGGAEYAADSLSKLSAVKLRGQWLEDFPAPQFGLDAASVRAIERMQGMGLRDGGAGVQSAGLYEEIDRAAVLQIPGRGSPVLGPGTWALLGADGEAARRRSPPTPVPGVKPAPKGEGTGGEKSAELSEEEEKAAAQEADDRLRRFLPSGAILRVDLDPEHWLAYGTGARAAVMAQQTDSFLARDPVATAARFGAPGEVHLGGLVWPEAVGRLAQTAYLTQERREKGQIILFANDPNFRGYFWGSRRLFLNAVLLGPGLGTEQFISW